MAYSFLLVIPANAPLISVTATKVGAQTLGTFTVASLGPDLRRDDRKGGVFIRPPDAWTPCCAAAVRYGR